MRVLRWGRTANVRPPPANPLDRGRVALSADFNLTRWFAAVALIAIALISAAAGVGLSWFVAERLLVQEARLTQEFVQSLVAADKTLQTYFNAPSEGIGPDTERALTHLAAMPDVLRTNVYDRQRQLIWSSDGQLVGRSFGHNEELERALGGEIVVERAHDSPREHGKDEHQELKPLQALFVEIYVPVRDVSGKRVLSVMEFYKNPKGLTTALHRLRIYIALGAGFFGALLFLALFGLVRRADRTIRSQQRQLVDTATLAAIGEMSSAVAHGIRNPLASIRSSAELLQDDPDRANEAADDIIAQSDRLEAWVSELLSYTRPLDGPPAPVPLQALVTRCLADFEREMQRRRITGSAELADGLPPVRGDPLLLGQVLRSLLANAIEALDHGGRITVRGACSGGRDGVTLSVEDNGPGMSAVQLARVGKPFYTTKGRGLGIGLAMARRVIERFGGRLEIESAAGHGTVVRLHMQAL